MQEIDNGDLTIKNIPFKIQMIKELIEQLKKEREDDFTLAEPARPERLGSG